MLSEQSRISHCIGSLFTMIHVKCLFDCTKRMVYSHCHSNEEGYTPHPQNNDGCATKFGQHR